MWHELNQIVLLKLKLVGSVYFCDPDSGVWISLGQTRHDDGRPAMAS